MKTIPTTIVTLFATAFVLPFASAAEKPPAEWGYWAKWAESQRSVGDGQGQCPDVGSDEWASALSKRLKITDAAGHSPDLKSEEWRKAVEKKLAELNGRELLSSHETEARFTGLKDHTCRGLTALCPDRCGESGKMAEFEIVTYLDYKKPGEYGDAKQKTFQVLIQDTQGNAKIPKETCDAILAFKPGEMVHLKWNHDYVTKDGSKFPERPIVLVEPLKKP
jgi:hypothetical protein